MFQILWFSLYLNLTVYHNLRLIFRCKCADTVARKEDFGS